MFVKQMNVTQRLTLGDKVVFGHRNGVRVKRGEFSPQTDSEFQFMVRLHVADVLEYDFRIVLMRLWIR